MHTDTFSVTLIGFFLTQPAFSLMGLSALVMRRRALMDLFSRAMRAQVLAQACIVLLAYLDLSSSSFYISQPDTLKSGGGAGFRMVPSMEMRFGPYRRPIQAGDTPGVNLLYSSSASAAGLNADSSSAHAHDTHVGDLQSRLTHLIVFLVQAALPILAMLIGQYMVAQRLAWLARRTSMSRQNSINKQQEKASPPTSTVSVASRRPYVRRTLPPSFISPDERLSSRISRAQNERSEVSPPRPSATFPVEAPLLPKKHHSGHTRSMSQPLDYLGVGSSTDKATIPTETASNFLASAPLSESPLKDE